MLPFILAQIILNSISACACLFFFYCYIQIPERGIGLQMIKYLPISDFIFHVSWLIQNWETPFVYGFTSILYESTFLFSLLWSANIAFFTYKILSFDTSIKPKLYLQWSPPVLAIIALTLGFLQYFLPVRGINLTEDSMQILAICLTTGFNLLSITYLRNSRAGERSEIPVRVLYRYAFVQIFTMGLASILALLNDAGVLVPIWLIYIASFCLSVAGLANAIVYFFQRSIFVRQSLGGEKRSFSSAASELEISARKDNFLEA